MIKLKELYEKDLFNETIKNARKPEYKDRSFGDLIQSKDESRCVPATYQMGRNYKSGGIMVVGQAKNGWEPPENSDLDDDFMEEMFKRANDPTQQFYLADCRGVKRDVDSKKIKKRDRWYATTSNYEKLVYCVVTGSDNFDDFQVGEKGMNDGEMKPLLLDSWPQLMVESELFKISPRKGGNPTGALATSQLDLCIKILKEEINLFEPSRILLGTGKNNLVKLRAAFGLNYIKNDKSCYILASGEYKNDKGSTSKIVICSRPERKSNKEIIKQAECIREEFEIC
jgi:hypothetical protein